ncbi:proliferation-associated protein 2G4 [Dermacentor silvarum]|nr:proliferation-associated protein 2G4 [Dermacentor silvarum]
MDGMPAGPSVRELQRKRQRYRDTPGCAEGIRYRVRLDTYRVLFRKRAQAGEKGWRDFTRWCVRQSWCDGADKLDDPKGNDSGIAKKWLLLSRNDVEALVDLPASPRQRRVEGAEKLQGLFPGSEKFFASRLIEDGWAAGKRARNHRDVGSRVHFEDERVPVDTHLNVPPVAGHRRDGVELDGSENNAVTDVIQKVAESYKCKPVEGMLSHQLKQYRIDGEKSIIQNPTEAQRKEHEKCEFELHEVYAIDVLVSTGEGKGREMDTRTTVYKRTDETYLLRSKASRAFLSIVDKQYASMPFTLRAFDEEIKAKMGVVECVNHKLLDPFQVLYEKEGEFVAQFKYTVLLMPSGSHRITGGQLDLDLFDSEYKVEDEALSALLNRSVIARSAKKKKKKAEKALLTGGDGAGEAENMDAAED